MVVVDPQRLAALEGKRLAEGRAPEPKFGNTGDGEILYQQYTQNAKAGGRAVHAVLSPPKATPQPERPSAQCTADEKQNALKQLNQMEDMRQQALARRAAAEEAAGLAEMRMQRVAAEPQAAPGADPLIAEQLEAIEVEQLERALREELDCGTPTDLDEAIRRVGANDPSVVKITIRRNDIGFAKAHALANAIAGSAYLLSLDFRYNKIGDHSCRLLADAIRVNRSLLELMLTPNTTGRDGKKYLSDVVKMCQYESMSISSSTLATPELANSPMLLRQPL